MKLVQLTEARYAGKYDVNQVRAQYMRTGPSYQGVFFDGATINPEANHVLAKFNIVAGYQKMKSVSRLESIIVSTRFHLVR